MEYQGVGIVFLILIQSAEALEEIVQPMGCFNNGIQVLENIFPH